ncbi:DinB family protein [Sphingobacterium sp. PCS056]|uniref:DinB family protein n=1 Tax=Sphingobacterium sp. PCS056 TaxID=2931400 RepID=UPI00200D965C|nr:DinB family protein [Sphingobacterium sp. PCS056]UPZ36085.1 DinB family protein [Sphingobacterium sp. PCS056]
MKTIIKVILTLSAGIILPFTALAVSDSNNTAILQTSIRKASPITILNPHGNIDSLLQYFQYTTQLLQNNISGLSEAQLQFSPGEGKWSISQCLEHIIRSEKMLFDMAQKELAKTAQPQRKNEVKTTDQDLITMMTDRSQKFQAPKELQPTGKYNNSSIAMSDFTAAREPVVQYIKRANLDDLRNHISEYPTGIVDGYQNLLFIAAHCARHIKQIEEVKKNPNFPKK